MTDSGAPLSRQDKLDRVVRENFDPATLEPHSTLLYRGVLLCSVSAPERVVHVGPDGICPVHNNGSCPLWYVPWPDTRRPSEVAGIAGEGAE